ncbi:MAG: aspartate--tRNA(Asn) ligase [Cenarchaeum symbiont of Oopsacas minuta]|nr:aspartate--tRNA(Asn) ligase [Cenarchaeum symbiont of Oopsacas minuta]
MSVKTELGSLRRTHYSTELHNVIESQVTVMGWVFAIRGHGNISFVTIHDKKGDIQVVAKAGSCPDDVMEKLSSLKPHSTVAITGTVVKSTKAPNGVEIVPKQLCVFSEVVGIPPFEPQAKTVKNIDTRLAIRAIDLRRKTLQDVFNTRNEVLKALRSYFSKQDFVEVHTPKIIASATEGGSSLFSIFYYDKEAYLAQSPQMYKEQLTMSFEKVFEISPIFRAESSRTNKHLSEAISIDIEEAFVDYNDIMDRVGEMIHIARDAALKSKESLRAEFNVPNVPKTIPQYTYAKILEMMKNKGVTSEWGDDLYPSNLEKIHLEGFYFIKDWPLGPKPFYVKAGSDGKTSESFDLMYGDLELSSGSTRIEKSDDLRRRIMDKGLKVDSFDYHLSTYKYGVPPHAGCGIGLERLMMALTGTENIRDVAFYPRDVDRLTP